MSYVEGSYDNPQDAFEAVKRLKIEGYKATDIRLISNTEMRDRFMNQTDVDMTTTDRYENESIRERSEEDESLWEKIKDAFTIDDDYEGDLKDPENDPLMNYRSDIEAGNIVVLVEGDSKATPTPSTESTRTTDRDLDTQVTDDETMRLKEERLDVDTKEVQTGEVHVSKKVVEETETVEVPVEHEEIVIERRPVDSDEKVTGNMTMEDDEMTIPVTEEQVEVTKEPVVTEEVTIGKEKVTDTKHIKEDLEKEELDVDTKGDIDVDDSSTRNQGRDKKHRR